MFQIWIHVRFRAVVVYLVSIGSLTGCQSMPENASEELKPKFHVLDSTVLHAEMRLMTAELQVLVDTYLDNSLLEPARQKKSLAALDRIQSIASGIGGGDIVTNYSVLNDYMGAFLYDVSIAKEFVVSTPPNYFPSGRLIQSCLACHQSM